MQDAIVNSAILKVEGLVRLATIKLVKIHVVNEGAAETKNAEVIGEKFSKYFVMSTPFPVVRVEGFTLDGKKLAEDFIEFKCGKPKGWKGPLPWEYSSDVPDDPGATSGAPPVAAPVQTRAAGGQTSAPASKKDDRASPRELVGDNSSSHRTFHHASRHRRSWTVHLE